MADKKADQHTLDKLYEVIASRKGGDPSKSYTAKLFGKGRNQITKKLGEEAVETIVAALGQEKKDVIAESADVMYHLMVLWADMGINSSDVWNELARREGVSGIEEKANRKKK